MRREGGPTRDAAGFSCQPARRNCCCGSARGNHQGGSFGARASVGRSPDQGIRQQIHLGNRRQKRLYKGREKENNGEVSLAIVDSRLDVPVSAALARGLVVLIEIVFGA